MKNFEEIKERNIQLLSVFKEDLGIKQSLEEILSYESLQVHKEIPKNRIRFMGLLKVNLGVDNEGKEKFKIKRIQLYSHRLESESSAQIIATYNFIRGIHLEYKKIIEIEDYENNILPMHLNMVPEYRKYFNH